MLKVVNQKRFQRGQGVNLTEVFLCGEVLKCFYFVIVDECAGSRVYFRRTSVCLSVCLLFSTFFIASEGLLRAESRLLLT